MNLRLLKVSTYLKTSLSSKKKRKNKNNFHPKEKKIFEYLNKNAKKHGDKAFLGQNVSPFDNTGESDVIDRTASHYNDAKEIRELKYILGVFEMKFQGMLEDIDTREKVAPPS